jgi:hypothetical protein
MDDFGSSPKADGKIRADQKATLGKNMLRQALITPLQ